MPPWSMLGHRSMVCTVFLVINHMYVQYIKAGTDWVVPQSVRLVYYGFPLKGRPRRTLSCSLDTLCALHTLRVPWCS